MLHAGGPHWRAMTPADLDAVERVGESVHPDYPEAADVLAERRDLYPGGSFVLECDGTVHGYAVAHPWWLGRPPKLDTKLHRIPEDADTFYLHDVALLPSARGAGAGAGVVALLAARAKRDRLATMSLVAVGFSVPFWERQGFRIAAPTATLSSYGAEARFMVRR